MLIENYKGIKVYHDATRDEFYTDIKTVKNSSKIKDKLYANRLQQMRDRIDGFLAATTPVKPIVDKVFIKDRYSDKYNEATLNLYNYLINQVVIEEENKNIRSIEVNDRWNNTYNVFLKNKNNMEILKKTEKIDADIKNLEAQKQLLLKSLIPLSVECFK